MPAWVNSVLVVPEALDAEAVRQTVLLAVHRPDLGRGADTGGLGLGQVGDVLQIAGRRPARRSRRRPRPGRCPAGRWSAGPPGGGCAAARWSRSPRSRPSRSGAECGSRWRPSATAPCRARRCWRCATRSGSLGSCTGRSRTESRSRCTHLRLAGCVVAISAKTARVRRVCRHRSSPQVVGEVPDDGEFYSPVTWCQSLSITFSIQRIVIDNVRPAAGRPL